MKKILLLSGIFILSVLNLSAADRFWVGGTGAWNNSSHWSATSGGHGGATIPTASDDVFFDQHSFSANKQTVMVTADAVCHNIDWSAIDDQAIFSSAPSRKLTVYGSYKLSSLLWNGFKGKTSFAASTTGNTITTFGKMIIGDWIFEGSGSWLLMDDMNTEKQVNIRLLKGSLNTNGKTIICGSFIGSSSQPRSLNLSSSEIFIKNKWDIEVPTNLTFNPATSRIIFYDSLDNEHYRSGNLVYNSVSAVATPCTPSGTPCANFAISITGINVTCNGDANGEATAVVTGGSGSFSYTWSPAVGSGAGTDHVTGLGAGTYTVKVKDNTTGLFCFCSISITEPGVLFDFELATTKPLCFGDCNGMSSVAATGGTGAYSFVWNTVPVQANDTAFNICAGTYNVTVTDVNGCSGSTTITVDQPVLLVAPGIANMVTCFGACNGTASVIASGGTVPYTYNWTPGTPPGDGTANITGLCPGSYTCTVTDSNSCRATFDTVITQPPLLTLGLTHTNATCGGICDGSATATITGGTSPYTYSWSNGTVTTATATLTNTISSICSGTYIVTITDAKGCTKTDSVVVTQPVVLVATATGANISCFGLCNGTAHAAVTGGTPGYTYDWTPGTPTGDGTANISSLCPGTYTVTVTDSHGCNDTGVVVITQPLALAVTVAGTNVQCFGACNGSATATPTGGTAPYSYSWGPGTPTGRLTPTITGLCPGTYSVTVTDAHGCTSVQSVVITQPPILNTGVTSTNVTCNGACNGTATSTPTGGTGPYSYLWSPGGATTPTISGLCPGVYTVTVTDANSCTKTGTVTITQPNILTVNITGTSLACNGDCNATSAITVFGGTPPYVIDWSPGTPIGDGTTSIRSLCAGTYTANVTDAHGCLTSATITISQPTALNLVSAVTDASCNGICDGSAAAIAGGGTPGYTYLWTPGALTTSSITHQCAGTYTVTTTDARGCKLKDTVTINQPEPLLDNATVVNNVSCVGSCNGSATALPTGGTSPYSYNWTPGTPIGDGTPTISSLCAGVYNVIVTDANSCSTTQPVTITQPFVLSAPIGSSTSSCNICNGSATVSPVGGTGPYTYLWMPTGQTTATATGLCPNITYTVTVTDANGCTATNTAIIFQTIIIDISTSNTTLSCTGSCNGIASASASGGTIPYSFIWAGSGGIVSLSQTATGLCAGTYTVTASDAAGCFNTDTVTFTDPPAVSISTTHVNVNCGGACNGTATVTASGGTGSFTYLWSPGGQTTATATSLCAGTYTVTVKDANGCPDTAQVTITEPPKVVDNPTFVLAHCTLADGSISVVPTGGTGTYSYNWGPGTPTGDGTATITNLLPGPYTLAITSGGCTFNFNYILNNAAGPTLTMAHTDISCHNICDGTATVGATGGIGSYTYDWTPGTPTGDGTLAVTALCGTTLYTVKVTDSVGCISLDTVTINNPSLISANATVVNESCGGSCNGSITLLPTGGTGPYTYLWTPGLQITSSISGLCAGAYHVTVTDAHNCDSVYTFIIASPPALSVTLTSTNVLCNGSCNGTATATSTGGTGGYTYSWTNLPAALVLPNVVNLCPNQYIVTVTDGNSCTAKDTVVITEPPVLTSVNTQTNVTCNSACDGTATITASGGTGAYTYSWIPGGATTPTATGLCAGTYNGTVTDANGCALTPPAFVITQPTLITPGATFTNPTCSTSCNGTAIANPTGGSGGYTYLWMPGSLVTQSVSGLCAGTYTVTVRDLNGCSNTQVITLIPPAPIIANATSTPPICANSCTGTLNASPIGGAGPYTYSWSPGGATTATVANACPVTYTVTVTDVTGCKDTQSVVVPNAPGIDITVGSTPASCGSCDGTITILSVTGTGPYTYVWTIGGISPPAPFAGQGTASVTNVCAGLYHVLVTDANGCDSTFVIPLNNSTGPTGETVVTTNTTCNGTCNGSGTVTPIGGVSPYTYLWNDTPGTTDATANNLCAGTYFVQVTDAHGCIRFSPVTIGQPDRIVSHETITNTPCGNVCTGTITLAPTGGTGAYTYAWGPGVLAGDGTPTISGLCSGTYSVTITDANLCTAVDSFLVGESAPLAATIASRSISCSAVCNGLAYVKITSGTGPYIIQWNDPSGQTNDTASALCAGDYSVTITDALGCIITLSTTVTATPPVAANAVITNASCGLCDGSATLTPSGGTSPYNYVWSNGQTLATATTLCAGLYTVDITDGAGCTTNFSIPVSNTGAPTSAVITSTNVTCNGTCDGTVTGITPVGGTPPYTYLWIASGATTPTLTGLCAGVYFVEITDTNGCSFMDSVTITAPAPIVANQVVTASTCGACDGNITIAPSGGTGPYTVLWNTGSTSLTLSSLCAGIYTVAITDANGCVKNITVPVNSQNGPTVSATSTNVLCNGACNGSTSASALTGVSPFTYLWSGGQTSPLVTGLCPGDYFVQVTGSDGCVSIASTTVAEPPTIGFSIAHTVDPLCNGTANGSVTTIASGGSLSYTYAWTPAPAAGQTTATAINLSANTYVVTLTDANGCTATQTTTLINPTSLSISNVSVNPSCNTVADGSIDVTVTGGTLPYAYQWSGGSTATTEDLPAVLEGSYTVTVTDSNSCTATDTIILTANQFIFASAGNDTSFCQSGALVLTASSINGTNYQWFRMPGNVPVGDSISTSVYPPTGITGYYVVVDNGTGCSDSDTILVTSNPPPTADAGPDVSIVMTASTPIGGSPTTSTTGATIQWNPIPGLDNGTSPNPIATPEGTTTYTVTVISPQGCIGEDSMTVTVLPTIIIPNGITPNGDGANDEWIIDGIQLFPNCTVEVYNRWGELLFQSVGYRDHWKGIYKDKPLPVGTYYYIIDLKDPLFPDSYTGPITIMR